MPYYKHGRLCFYNKPLDVPGTIPPAVNTERRLHAIWDKDREYVLTLKDLIVTLFKPGYDELKP